MPSGRIPYSSSKGRALEKEVLGDHRGSALIDIMWFMCGMHFAI